MVFTAPDIRKRRAEASFYRILPRRWLIYDGIRLCTDPCSFTVGVFALPSVRRHVCSIIFHIGAASAPEIF
jgi:hypothetical protein